MKIETLSKPTPPFCRYASRADAPSFAILKANLEKQGFNVAIRLENQRIEAKPGDAFIEFWGEGFVSVIWLKRAA